MRRVAALLALVIVFASLPAAAFEIGKEWGPVDTGLALTTLTLLGADWLQTRDIRNHPGVYETNPILGEHPSNKRVDTYFAVSALATAVGVAVLPPGVRRWLMSGVILVEASVVINNHEVGLRVRLIQ